MAAEHLLLHVGDDDGRYTLELRHDPARPARVLELRERYEPGGAAGRHLDQRLLIPTSALAALSAYLGPRVPPATASGGYPRLLAAVTAAVGAGTLAASERGRNWQEVVRWCERAGAGHETFTVDPDGRECGRRRSIALARWAGTGGRTGTLWLRFDSSQPPDAAGGVVFAEHHAPPGPGPHHFEYGLALPYAAIDELTAVLRGRLGGAPPDAAEHPESRLADHLAALVDRGDLGGHLPVRASRERLLAWCAEAGIRYERAGRDRRETLAEKSLAHAGEVCSLVVGFGAVGTRPSVTFEEAYQPPGDVDGGYGYQAQAPYESLPALAEHVATRAGLPPAGRSPDPEDLLVAALAALVARGELAPGLPRRLNRDRVAGWFTESGAECQVRGDARRHTLLKTRRRDTRCLFELSVTLRPDDARTGIAFTEFYDYLARPGDGGREYGYTASAPYPALETVVDFLERRFGRAGGVAADLEDRLIAGLAAAVRRGDLGDRQPLRANRDRVLDWLAEAGVPGEVDDWSWFDSD